MTSAHRSQYLSGLARIAFAGMLWGTIPLLVRLIFAALVALTVVSSRGERGRWRGLQRRHRTAILGIGVLLACNWVLYLASLQLTKVAVAVILAYCGPVIVAGLAPIVTRERFDRRLLVPLALSFAGVVTIVGPRDIALADGTEHLGALLALASAFTYALLVVNAKRLLAHVPAPVYMLGEYAGAALVLAPALFLFPGPSGPAAWAAIAALGIVDTGLTGLIFLSGLRRVRADHAAMLTYAEPLSAVLLSAIFLHERLTPLTLAGGIAILTAGLLVARMEPQPALEAPETSPIETAVEV